MAAWRLALRASLTHRAESFSKPLGIQGLLAEDDFIGRRIPLWFMAGI